MPHILVVCTANICRSPVAEGLLLQRIGSSGMTGWSASSAGTWAIEARRPAKHSIQLMAERGIDISDHIAQMITVEALAQADLVLCMEKGQVEALSFEFPQEAHKIYLLSEMGGRRHNILDPFGQDLHEYRQMVSEVAELIEEGWPKIISLATDNA